MQGILLSKFIEHGDPLAEGKAKEAEKKKSFSVGEIIKASNANTRMEKISAIQSAMIGLIGGYVSDELAGEILAFYERDGVCTVGVVRGKRTNSENHKGRN